MTFLFLIYLCSHLPPLEISYSSKKILHCKMFAWCSLKSHQAIYLSSPSYQSAVLLFHTHPLLQLWVTLQFSHACLFLCCPLYPLISQDPIWKHPMDKFGPAGITAPVRISRIFCLDQWWFPAAWMNFSLQCRGWRVQFGRALSVKKSVFKHRSTLVSSPSPSPAPSRHCPLNKRKTIGLGQGSLVWQNRWHIVQKTLQTRVRH